MELCNLSEWGLMSVCPSCWESVTPPCPPLVHMCIFTPGGHSCIVCRPTHKYVSATISTDFTTDQITRSLFMCKQCVGRNKNDWMAFSFDVSVLMSQRFWWANDVALKCGWGWLDVIGKQRAAANVGDTQQTYPPPPVLVHHYHSTNKERFILLSKMVHYDTDFFNFQVIWTTN